MIDSIKIILFVIFICVSFGLGMTVERMNKEREEAQK